MTISATRSAIGQVPIPRASSLPVQDGVPITELKILAPPGGLRQFPKSMSTFPSLDTNSMLEALKGLEVNDFASNQPFAEVYKNGKLVARIDNGGGATTYGAAGGIITGDNEPYPGGPELAQWRADKIAKAVGGTVRIADTAQTQSQWEVSYAQEQSRVKQAMAPYRAAMDAYRAAWDAWTADQAAEVSASA